MRVAVYDDEGHSQFGFTFKLNNLDTRGVWDVIEHVVNLMIDEDKKH